MNIEPLSVSYDAEKDILTVNRREYSGELFRSGFNPTSEGECWRTKVEGGRLVVSVQPHGF